MDAALALDVITKIEPGTETILVLGKAYNVQGTMIGKKTTLSYALGDPLSIMPSDQMPEFVSPPSLVQLQNIWRKVPLMSKENSRA